MERERNAERGDLSARVPPKGIDCHPTPLALRAIDPPPPGEGKKEIQEPFSLARIQYPERRETSR